MTKSKDIYDHFACVGNGNTLKRHCIHCSKQITSKHTIRWEQHLRNCPKAPPDARVRFSQPSLQPVPTKRRHDSATSNAPMSKHSERQLSNAQVGMHAFVDKVDAQQKRHLDQMCAKLFFSTGLPFALAQSKAWKEYNAALRPAYKPPCSKTIGGSLLDSAFEDHVTETSKQLNEAEFVSIVTDGFGNVRKQHLVNYVAHTSKVGSSPIVLAIKSTEDSVQSGTTIASGIVDVLKTVGIDKVASVVTDNASNMQAAWKIIERDHPHIVCNGCAAHTFNLLVKDVCELDKYKVPLEMAKQITAFVQSRPQLVHQFRTIQQQHKSDNPTAKAETLVFVCETRWYTHVACVKRVLQNQDVLQQLVASPSFRRLPETANKKEVATTISDAGFWQTCQSFLTALEPTSTIIGRLESNNSLLSDVYAAFLDLLRLWADDVDLYPIALSRWQFIHTPSMGFSYVLTPRYRAQGMYEGQGMNDLLEVLEELPHYIVNKRHISNDIAIVARELDDYIEFVSLASGTDWKLICKLSAHAWWSLVGEKRFPNLAVAARVLLNIPTSQAASERVWSMYDFIHSKRRCRLGVDKASKLVILYANSKTTSAEASIVDILTGIASDDDADLPSDDDEETKDD